MFIRLKKLLVCKYVFLSLLRSFYNKLNIILKVAYQIVTQNIIYKIFMTQSTVKVPRPNKINFQIL